MSPRDLADLVGLLTHGGLAGMLAFELIVLALGAYRMWWVPGPRYKQLERRCDRWQQLALQAFADADKTVSLAEFFRDVAGDER